MTTATRVEAEAGTETPDVSQRVSLLVGVVLSVLAVAALGVADMLPPISPSATPEEVAAHYSENRVRIQIGLLVFNVCGIFMIAFFVVIIQQMRRMRLSSSALPNAYLICMAGGAGLYLLADLIWLVAAFRPERDPEVIQLLNDLGTLCFTAPTGIIVCQLLTLALAILLDDPLEPVLPRWVGYFNVACAAALIPSVTAVMHLTGPLAWDGAVSFWVRNLAFLVYVAVMFVVLRTALRCPQETSRAKVPS